MELPKQLKANRERLGLSQEETAKRIFVSRQTVSNWETGKTCPDVQSLLLLSNLFGVSIDELVKGDVETMKNDISKESRRLKRLGRAMAGFMLAALAMVAGAIVLRDVGKTSPLGMSYLSFAAIVFAGLLWLCSFASAIRAEILKRRNNLVTYREIVAFEQGTPVEEVRKQDALGRKHPVIHSLIMTAAGASTALIALVVFEVVAKTIRDVVL